MKYTGFAASLLEEDVSRWKSALFIQDYPECETSDGWSTTSFKTFLTGNLQ